MQGYICYHEMDYGELHLERGQYIELEMGVNKNDNSLLTIGYLKEHDGAELLPCLRCGKQFVTNTNRMFLTKHEETCPMSEIAVPPAPESLSSDNGQNPESGSGSESKPETLAELQAAAAAPSEGE